MSPQCTFNTGGLWQSQPRLLVLFRLVLRDLSHSQPSDWLSLTEKHSILRFLIQKFLNRAQVYFILPTPESITVMAGNYCVSAPRGRKSRMRNSWDCPFNTRLFRLTRNQNLNISKLLERAPYFWLFLWDKKWKIYFQITVYDGLHVLFQSTNDTQINFVIDGVSIELWTEINLTLSVHFVGTIKINLNASEA